MAAAEVDQLATALGELELFADLDDGDLAKIGSLVSEVTTVVDGDAICLEGTTASEWWIVLEGQADVTIDGIYVGSVGEGETIGELAALDREVRSATVTARADVTIAAISTDRFDELLELSPSITKALLRQMSNRLRTASKAAAEPVRAPTVSPKTAAPTPAPITPDEFDPLDPAFFDNPYTTYAALRDAGVVYNDLIGSWIVGRYDDVSQLMRDRSISSDVQVATRTPIIEELIKSDAEIGDPQTMGRFDGPEHLRIRRLVTSAFTPKAMRKIRDDITDLANELLDGAAAQGEADFVESVALPMPSRVISRMLGVPSEDEDFLHELSTLATQLPEPLATPEQRAEIKAAVQALRAYMLDLVETRRTEPGDDVLSAMVHAHYEDERLTRMELVDNAGLLYIAGHITTVILLTSMVAMLWDHPDQLAAVRNDLSLIPNAVEETLRYASPVQFGRRFTVAPIEVAGQQIPAGASIITAIGSANHDPRHFGDDAHEYRVDRSGAHRHLTFASGAHFCAGAALARMEAEIMLELLLRRFPHLAVTSDERPWSMAFVLRGLERLPVRLAP